MWDRRGRRSNGAAQASSSGALRKKRIWSKLSHTWLRWINQREVHWPDAANGDDGRLAVAANDTVVERRSGDPVDEAAGGHWNAGRRIEICTLLHRHVPETTTQKRSVV